MTGIIWYIYNEFLKKDGSCWKKHGKKNVIDRNVIKISGRTGAYRTTRNNFFGDSSFGATKYFYVLYFQIEISVRS